MAAPFDLPSRGEYVAAYSAATLASLVWVGTVLPGVHLAAPGAADDETAPMLRASYLLIPALLLLVAGPVTAVLARWITGLRALLASGTVFVALYCAGGFAASAQRDTGPWIAAGILALIGLLALRDVVRLLRQVPAPAEVPGSDPAAESSPKPAPGVDVRLALSLLALLTPAWLVAQADRERGSLLAPFVYLAVSAVGERFARRPATLRMTAAIVMALLSAHTLVTLRWALMRDGNGFTRWTWCGWTTLALAAAMFVVNVMWAVVSARRPALADAAPAAGSPVEGQSPGPEGAKA